MQHDAIDVHVRNKVVNEFIKSICQHPEPSVYIIRMCDRALQKFNTSKNFVNFSLYMQDFAIPIEWHFFGCAHGKGRYDGAGGTAKQLTAPASLQLSSKRQTLTPWELYQWESQPADGPAIAVHYSTMADYNANKEFFFSIGKFQNDTANQKQY